MRSPRFPHLIFVAATTSLLAGSVVLGVQKPNFSGTWRVDVERSTRTSTPVPNPDPEAPPPPPPPPTGKAPPQILAHTEPTLTFREDPAAPALHLTTDGQENVNAMFGGRINRS